MSEEVLALYPDPGISIDRKRKILTSYDFLIEYMNVFVEAIQLTCYNVWWVRVGSHEYSCTNQWQGRWTEPTMPSLGTAYRFTLPWNV